MTPVLASPFGPAGLALAHLLGLMVLPVLLVGLVNRSKAWWGGRRGPPVLQLAWDLQRLARKQPVVSGVTTPLFLALPWVVLVATVLAALIAPLWGAFAPLQFEHDFVVLAYALGLARLATVLAAFDVGSAFEGLGGAREVAFAAFAEPAFFLLAGTLALGSGQTSLAAALGTWQQGPAYPWMALPAVLVLFVLLQVEAARVPVDDPQTHLELTMIHEVMVLDHSGPELGALQFAAALRLCLYAGLIASLLNPFDVHSEPWLALPCALALLAGVAVAVGCVESLVARLRLRWVPRYLLSATVLAALLLGLGTWLGVA